MRALPLLLAVAGCAHTPTLQPAQLERLERAGRVAFVVAPRGWDRAEMFTLVGGWMAPHSCVTCTPPDAVAAFEQALGGIFEDFLAEELGRIASASL